MLGLGLGLGLGFRVRVNTVLNRMVYCEEFTNQQAICCKVITSRR